MHTIAVQPRGEELALFSMREHPASRLQGEAGAGSRGSGLDRPVAGQMHSAAVMACLPAR